MKFTYPLVACFLVVAHSVLAQSVTGSNVITSAAPFLTVSPDARRAALGEAGVASSPDANTSYWNPGALVHIDKLYGGSLSYTPWLGKIVNDMDIVYLSGFYKITREQVVSASIKYFNMGEIFFKDAAGNSLGDYNPRDFAFDATYSRMLTENFSVGLTGRYIYSNLTGFYNDPTTQVDSKPGRSAAVDAGVFYTKPMKSTKFSQLALAAVISNIGGKISYSDENNRSFLPTNLRVGSALTKDLDIYNKITFLLDFNKLLIPTPDSTTNNQDQSMLSGMFGSFSDAPGGAREELKEISTSVGIEYWYNAVFAGRLGYFRESKEKGNRQYITFGLGFRKEKFGIDVAYLVPTNGRENPLAETIRFGILYQIEEIRAVDKESVTDQ